MGRFAQILLVVLGILYAGTSVACDPKPVVASDYRAFWLWGGVAMPSEVGQIDTLYLYQGEVGAQDARWQRGGQPVARLAVPRLWLTVRLETLALSEPELTRLARLPERWRQAGNFVVGLQIDFDAATYRLKDYGKLLQRLRARLDPRYSLSVTGLLDWAQTGSIAALNQLPVDEIVIQTYQGRQSVVNYSAYLKSLQLLQRPFRIGVVQGGVWRRCLESTLARSPWFRGMVVFVSPDM